jgi:pyridoxamine 5'-phosphate oxidase-like protein
VAPTTLTELTPAARAFLDAPRVTTLATVTADGAPVQAVIWFRLDAGDTILVNSRLPRRWPTALLHSRRASLSVIDELDGMRWLGIDCHVIEVDEDIDRARADIVALAHRYDDLGAIPRFMTQSRITFRLAIDKIHDHLDE